MSKRLPSHRQIKPAHALIRIAACGVCRSDIPRVLFKGAHKLPLICGHEFSGHIEELGSGMEGWQLGELVTVPPLIPCGTCEQCLRGVPSRCEDYDYFGSRRDGAYTEYASSRFCGSDMSPYSLLSQDCPP